MLQIHTRTQDDATTVTVSGDVDLYSSPEVRKIIMALTEEETPFILIDLHGVQYMDSSGIATLVEGLQQVGKYDGRLILYGLNNAVREVFELSRLDRVFQIFPNAEAAQQSLQSDASGT